MTTFEKFSKLVRGNSNSLMLSDCCGVPVSYRINTDEDVCWECQQGCNWHDVTKEQWDEGCKALYESRYREVN